MQMQSVNKITDMLDLFYANKHMSDHMYHQNKSKEEDSMTKERFEDLLLIAREQYKQANRTMNELFNELVQQMPQVDLSLTPTHAEGSRSLEDALIHFMQDGRSDADTLWEDLKKVQELQEEYER